MIRVEDLREQLNRLVAGQIPLDQLENWLVENSWNMHRDSDPVAQSLVSSVELRLAEHSSGHLLTGQMMDEFRALLAGNTEEYPALSDVKKS